MQSSVYDHDSKRKRSMELSFTEHQSTSRRRIISSSSLPNIYNSSFEMALNDKQGLPTPSLSVPSHCPLHLSAYCRPLQTPMSNVTIVGPKGEIKTSVLNELIVKSINSQAFIGAFLHLSQRQLLPPKFNSSSKVASNH